MREWYSEKSDNVMVVSDDNEADICCVSDDRMDDDIREDWMDDDTSDDNLSETTETVVSVSQTSLIISNSSSMSVGILPCDLKYTKRLAWNIKGLSQIVGRLIIHEQEPTISV